MSRRTQLAAGEVHVKKGRLQSKKVKYIVVCLGDESSASFIEVHDNKAHFETPTNKHKPKVYQLENIKPDDLDKVERNQAKEYYLDIPFKKEKMCLMFDSREELALWHDAIVQAINMDAFEEDDLKENFLYESEDSAQVFDVVAQETEASKRLNLENCGKFKLFVTMASLGLEDSKTHEIKCKWHFEFIRRYGFTKSRNLFTIEAGRRCETGEGTFDFHIVGNPKALTLAIDNATKAKQSRTVTSTLTRNIEPDNTKEQPAKVRDSAKSVKSRASEPLTRKSADSLNLENSKGSQSEDETQTPSNLHLSFKNSLEATISHHPTSPKPQKEGSSKEKKRGFSFPWKKDKGEKKDSNKSLEGSENSKGTDNEPTDLYDEPLVPVSSKPSVKVKKSEPIYDEAGENNNTVPSVRPPVYTEPAKQKTESSRKKQGVEETATKDGRNMPSIPDRKYEEEEDDDETYDHVELKAENSNPRKPKEALALPEHIYGIGSGKKIEDIDDDDYACADFPENEQKVVTAKAAKPSEQEEENDYEFENVDEDDTYADTMNPSEDYADAMSCVRTEPTPKPRPQLYEDVS